MFHPLRQSSICMFWVAMSIKIWSLIIVSVEEPPTSIYRAKQSSVFKRMPCLPGSWHMVECGIFVITGQFCAGWCYYYFTSSRSQNRIMTCYEWPQNHCAALWLFLRRNSSVFFLFFFCKKIIWQNADEFQLYMGDTKENAIGVPNLHGGQSGAHPREGPGGPGPSPEDLPSTRFSGFLPLNCVICIFAACVRNIFAVW